MKKILTLTILALAMGGCAYTQERSHHAKKMDVQTYQDWGNLDTVHQYKHLYFSGQPDKAALEAFQAAGGKIVVNLREPSETDFKEKSIVEALGMKYRQVSVPKQGPLSEVAMEKIESSVHEEGHVPTLLHCSSGARAAAWFAIHEVSEHGMDVEKAIAMAEQVGLENENMKEKVRDYFK